NKYFRKALLGFIPMLLLAGLLAIGLKPQIASATTCYGINISETIDCTTANAKNKAFLEANKCYQLQFDTVAQDNSLIFAEVDCTSKTDTTRKVECFEETVTVPKETSDQEACRGHGGMKGCSAKPDTDPCHN